MTRAVVAQAMREMVPPRGAASAMCERLGGRYRVGGATSLAR